MFNIQDVEITGIKDSRRINFRLRKIGFVFQRYNLIPVFTARENVAFIMLLQNRSKKEIGRRTDQLLDEVGLGDRKDARPAEISGGQQQFSL